MTEPIVEDALLERLSALATPERLARMDSVLNKRTRHLSVVLENLYQPHNTAAVLRSCECFGIQDVHIIENSHRFERSKGVSMGADKWLSLHRYNKNDSNTTECLETLRKKGYRLAATTLREGAIPLHELPIDKPVALLFGTEEHGLSEEAHALADDFVYLPMHGFTQSFNISVSCALALYDLRTRLDKNPSHKGLSETERKTLKFEWLIKSIRAAEDILAVWQSEQDKLNA